ncbi:hypothetical protein GQX73_g3414 [Xylaria multiplex]|uniref:Beta-lactamase-related domain-containing protein n=1 Tax=Xylaria multiplex TaxID=323545 RepID=A0A7C8MWD3_9PEZI|nr:hypothetical protein GQX73_g3414 [Xylaria multiplex]
MSTDITNWRDAGHNIWGFQNADKILKTSMVQYRPEPTKFKSTTLDLHGFKLRGQDETPLNLPTFLSQTETDGLVVLKNGIIAFEYYGRTNTRQSVHAIFSISKSITSLICGVLEEQGKLKPEDLVSSHIPEVQGSAYENVTIRQLLDMRSGIEHDDAAPGYRNATGLYPINPDAPPTDLHSYLPSIKSSSPRPVVGLDGPPYEYSSPNIDLLGWAIERASGKKLPDVLTEVLWQPMGAENIAHFITDRSGNARAAGGDMRNNSRHRSRRSSSSPT